MHIDEALYRQIVKVMPVPCVDLLIEDGSGMVLLVKRRIEPAQGQWWFPGGRVHFQETRRDAALRKLREECGLSASMIAEAGTYELLIDVPGSPAPSHGITTVYHILTARTALTLDRQSEGARWQAAALWRSGPLHPFVRRVIEAFESGHRRFEAGPEPR